VSSHNVTAPRRAVSLLMYRARLGFLLRLIPWLCFLLRVLLRGCCRIEADYHSDTYFERERERVCVRVMICVRRSLSCISSDVKMTRTVWVRVHEDRIAKHRVRVRVRTLFSNHGEISVQHGRVTTR